MTCGQAVSSQGLVGGLCAALEAASPPQALGSPEGGREGGMRPQQLPGKILPGGKGHSLIPLVLLRAIFS